MARSQSITSACEKQAKEVRNVWEKYERGVENVPKKRNLFGKCKKYQIYMEIRELKIMNESENS
jgi:hypothetical protein